MKTVYNQIISSQIEEKKCFYYSTCQYSNFHSLFLLNFNLSSLSLLLVPGHRCMERYRLNHTQTHSHTHKYVREHRHTKTQHTPSEKRFLPLISKMQSLSAPRRLFCSLQYLFTCIKVTKVLSGFDA